MMKKSVNKMVLITGLLSVFIFVDALYNTTSAWDRNANIKKSVNEFFNQMNLGGMNGVEEHVKALYESHDKNNPSNLKSLESCASLDIAAYLFEGNLPAAQKQYSSGYFANIEGGLNV